MSSRHWISQSRTTRPNPEDTFAFQLKAAKLSFKRQVKFHPLRQWRADFIVEDRVLVEVEGGLYVNGGHNRGALIEDTMVKLAEASMLGYFPLRVSPSHVNKGLALKWVEKLLAALRRGGLPGNPRAPTPPL